MIEIFFPFIKQILSFCGYKLSDISRKYYTDLLTAFQDLPCQQFVMIPSLIELAKQYPGKLLIDDTDNPKYGLKNFSLNLKNRSTGAVRTGYKIVLFLWQTETFRIPIGFALCHQESPTPSQLAIIGLSLLRNRYSLVPEWVLADAGYETDEITHRLSQYGWRQITRCKCSRKIDEKQAKHAIPRAYGEETGVLANGIKVKVVRRKGFFLLCNRLMIEAEEILALYRNRWQVEEVFRALKQTIGLDRCQQHSMQAQSIYLFLSLLVFACLELHCAEFGHSIYYFHQQVILGNLQPEDIIKPELFTLS